MGWLEPGYPYSRGGLDEPFVRALIKLAECPFQPIAFGGPHVCGFCRISGNSSYNWRSGVIGSENLFIPNGDRMFVAPVGILYYMDAHEYGPSADFGRAVLACPPMDTPQYKRAFLKAGGAALIRASMP
jgi:hypothetical protein